MELNRTALELNRVAFERNGVAFECNTRAFERMMATLDRHEQLFEESRGDKDDLKVFIRDTNLRAEKTIEKLMRRMEMHSAEESRRTDAIVARLDDLTQESRAQRQALLALIERLPPPAEAA